jgi:chromosome partitioning protein
MKRRRRVLAISALKGGVGKTTTAVNLAAAAARAGRSVLLVDLDPQGSVAACLGLDEGGGVDAWLSGRGTFADVVRRGTREGLDVLTAGPGLLGAEDHLREKGRDKRVHRLANRIEDLEGEGYEVIVIDCAPSASLLLSNAFFAADELILPAKLDYLSLPGLERTREYAKEHDHEREKPLRIAGILPTFHDLRTNMSEEVLAVLRERFTKVLTPIRINADLAEAPALGKTIFEYSGSSRGAVDYALLAEDLRLA